MFEFPKIVKLAFGGLVALVALREGERFCRSISARLSGDAEAKQRLVSMLNDIEDPEERSRVQAMILAL